MKQAKGLREKIAAVLYEDLPWREEDLLELADKIIAVLPRNKKKR